MNQVVLLAFFIIFLRSCALENEEQEKVLHVVSKQQNLCGTHGVPCNLYPNCCNLHVCASGRCVRLANIIHKCLKNGEQCRVGEECCSNRCVASNIINAGRCRPGNYCGVTGARCGR